VRSFLDVFPHASLWTTEVAAALREVGIASPAALLATWVTGRAGLERYVDGVPPVTDDHPRIEYATWVRPKEFARVLPRLLAPRTDPPLRGTDEAFLAALADERNRLFRFYGAGLYAYNGERELSAREMNRVMRGDGRNPYYRWFVGRGW
jgi:spermidine synthase